MGLFRRRIGERLTDVLEWVDYRRDASFWPLLAVPPLLSVAWAYGGWIGLGILFSFAAGTTILLCLLATLSLAGWVVGKAAIDAVVPAFRSNRPTRRASAGSPATSR